MKSGELDKRVGDYAAAIVRDVDLLLADAANLNTEQQKFVAELKRHAVRLLSLYTEHLTVFSDLTHEAIVTVHDLRNPLGLIEGYCDLLLRGEVGSLSQSQLQLLQQIKFAQVFIFDAFIIWVNLGYEAS